MRVVTQFQSFNRSYGKSGNKTQPQNKEMKKEIKHKLNLIMGKNQHPLVEDISEQKINKIMLKGYQKKETMKTTTKQFKNTRSQSLSKTPKPVSSLNQYYQITKQSTEQLMLPPRHKSCHSLDIKHVPNLKIRSTTPFKQLHTSKKTTASLKSPLSSRKKILLNPQSRQSSQTTHISNLKQSPIHNLSSFCKNIKNSIYYDDKFLQQTLLKVPQQKLSFFKNIPSSQLPNQYAISRDPSYDVIDFYDEEYKTKQQKQ